MDIYPYVETLKVGTAYAVLLYIWPCILFRRVLRNKGLTFRFLFCSIVQPVLLSTVVLTLGLFHILNVWIVRVLFWGALTVSLLEPFWGANRQGGVSARALMMESHGWKLLFSRIVDALVKRLKMIWRMFQKKSEEYLVLAAVLLFGMAFFLNGAFHHYSFGESDQYTHYVWTCALLKGEIFTSGVYPEGMHCFLYALHVLLGVKLHSCVVFLGGIHNSSTFILAAYCLYKKLFRSRHTALFVLTANLVFNSFDWRSLLSKARMAWTMPQEFSLYLVLLCPLLLLRYFREQDKPEKWYQDENLLLLMVGVALAVSTHFYVLIMVFCSCCAVALVYYRQLWPARRLLAPVRAALYGIELGAFPMLVACVMGIDLENSLLWGVHTLYGVSGSSVRRVDSITVTHSVQNNPLKVLFENGYLGLFRKAGAGLLILVSLLVPVLAAVYVCARRRGKLRKIVLPAGMMEGYLFLIAALTVFIFLYAMPYMGLPELVAISRPLMATHVFAFGVLGILIDPLILWGEHWRGRIPPRYSLVFGCLFIYFFAYMTDFHQSSYWQLGRYNAEVAVTDQIMDHYPEGTYKVVSMWEEAYQVGDGSHEELLTFLENIEREDYSIPVEYIFLYVEKRPLQRGQAHGLTAPRWLARENYGLYEESQCPDIVHLEISQELAQKETPYYPEILDNYKDLTIRAILCSKIFSWYQEFSVAHPAEANVYYEDDDFVCYVIHQDQTAPLELAAGRGDGK